MNALVTGAGGFIGTFLTAELLAKGHTVRALALPGEDASRLLGLGVDVRRGDLTKPESLHGLCNGIDTVFHLAGRVTDWGTRKQFYDAILVATKNLLEEAAGRASRFVYISSIAAMGFGRHMRGTRETDPTRKSGVPYNDAKADAERLVRDFHDAGKIKCTIVRPANVIGPGSAWVRDLLDKMKGWLPVIDGGRYSGSFVYVENLVDGIILAGTKKIAEGKAYQFRDDWNVSWKQYLNDLGAFIGKRPVGNIPFRLAWTLAVIMDAVFAPLHLRPPLSRLGIAVLGRDNDVDTSLARSELGWKTRLSYEEAMERIGLWVAERYGRPGPR